MDILYHIILLLLYIVISYHIVIVICIDACNYQLQLCVQYPSTLDRLVPWKRKWFDASAACDISSITLLGMFSLSLWCKIEFSIAQSLETC